MLLPQSPHPSEPRAIDLTHLVLVDTTHFRAEILRLRGVLCGREDFQRPRLPGHCQRGVRLQVEVLLSTDLRRSWGAMAAEASVKDREIDVREPLERCTS